MNASKNKIYTALNKEGFLCSYDSETHRCVGVMLAMGNDIELYNQKHNEWIGQLDPKFEQSEQGATK